MKQFLWNRHVSRYGRKCRTVTAVWLLALLLFTGCGGNQQSAAYIGEEEAKAIALEQAGVSAEEATFSYVELDRDDGQPVYELEFRAGDTEYEYEIHAETGRVLKAEHDILNRNDGKNSNTITDNKENGSAQSKK